MVLKGIIVFLLFGEYFEGFCCEEKIERAVWLKEVETANGFLR